MDIDKIFISWISYTKKGDTNFKEDSVEYHRNRLINYYLTILKDSERSFAELNGSIDTDTELLTDIVKDLRQGSSKKLLLPYSTYTLRMQSQAKDLFVNGKRGIGPFALNNNSHILALLYGLEFADDGGIMQQLGLTSLHNPKDRDDRSISSWLSGLINIHVDVAKDPVINELGINPYTYNLINLLVRTGLGKMTFYFTTQPIMKKLATAYQNASGAYMLDSDTPRYILQQKAEEKVILDMCKEVGISAKNVDEAFKKWALTKDNNWEKWLEDSVKHLFAKGNETLRQVAKSNINNIAQDDRTFDGMSVFDIQMMVAYANTLFKPYAQALSDLVKYSKIDTKKEGKSIIEQRDFLRGYNALFAENSISQKRRMFKPDGLNRLRDATYIGYKTEKATALFTDILGNQLIEATDAFALNVDYIIEQIGGIAESQKLTKTVINAVNTAIKARYIRQYALDNNIDVRSLIYGNKTIYDFLLIIKANLMHNPDYADLVDKMTGEPRNYLLRNLVSDTSFNILDKNTAEQNEAKFIQPLSFMNDDIIDADQMSQAWDALLRDTKHPELLTFAKRLIVYAFITSGDNGGRNDLFKFVPNSWKLNTEGKYEDSYAYHMTKMLANYRAKQNLLTDDELDNIILNNWQDKRFVREYSYNQFTSFLSGEMPIIMSGLRDGNVTILASEAPLFIKIPKDKDRKIWAVYKRVAVGKTKPSNDGKSVMYPVYALVSVKDDIFYNKLNIDKYHNIIDLFGNASAETRKYTEQAFSNLALIFGLQINNPYDAINKILEDIKNRIEGKQQSTISFINELVKNRIIDPVFGATISGISRFNESLTPTQSLKETTVNFYEGDIVPSPNTVFVFGSNPNGIHGAGAARTAAMLFGALYGVGEGLTGQSYALPTKDLDKAKGTRWYKPGKKEEAEVKEWYKTHNYSEVANHPLNAERTITPLQIIESIKRLYETARQNPDMQFKVSNYPIGKISLNGYIGEEMIEMFKAAGDIPSNVIFSKEWVDTGMFDTLVKPQTQTTTAANNTYPVPGTTPSVKPTLEDLLKALAKYFSTDGGIDSDTHLNDLIHTNPTDDYVSSESNKIVDWIINNSKNEDNVLISKLIKPYVDKHPVKVWFTHEDPDLLKRGNRSGHMIGTYGKSGITAAIEMFPNSSFFKQHPEQSLLHEIVHSISSAMVEILDTNSEIEALDEYVNYVRNYLLGKSLLPAEMIYGLSNRREFVAEAITNPYFLAILKQVPAMDQTKFNNMFELFIDWISKVILYISGIKHPTNALDQITPILKGIIEILSNIDYKAPLTDLISNLLDDQQKHNFTHPINLIISAISTNISESVFNNADSSIVNNNGYGYIYLSDEKGDAFYLFHYSYSGIINIIGELRPNSKRALKWVDFINNTLNDNQFNIITYSLKQLGSELMEKCK